MHSLIAASDDRFTIDEKHSVLSLVRKPGDEHAFLILERPKDDDRENIAIELVIKKGSHGKKASIKSGSIIVKDLESIARGKTAICYQITKEQETQLLDLVASEIKRSQEDKINYVKMGKSEMTGKLGQFFTQHGSVESKNSSETRSGNSSSLDSLLRDGHNCISWCYAMLEALGLITPTSATHIFAIIPSVDIKASLRDGGTSNPGCLIM